VSTDLTFGGCQNDGGIKESSYDLAVRERAAVCLHDIYANIIQRIEEILAIKFFTPPFNFLHVNSPLSFLTYYIQLQNPNNPQHTSYTHHIQHTAYIRADKHKVPETKNIEEGSARRNITRKHDHDPHK
jgi:hypothetical protein